MKTSITILALLISIMSFAQSQDGYISTAYLGYANGQHAVRVTSKQHCSTDIQFRYSVMPSAINPNTKNNIKENVVPAMGSQVFYITGPQTMTIEVNSRTQCDWAGQSSIWVNPLSNVLPMKLKYLKLEKIDATHIKATFEVLEETNVSHYDMQYSLDGINFKNVVLIISSMGAEGFKGPYVAAFEIKK